MKKFITSFIFLLYAFYACGDVSVIIKGVEPEGKKIRDDESLKIYWEANAEGTYTVSLSSTNFQRYILSSYRDVSYPSPGISFVVLIEPLKDLSPEGYTIDDVYYVNIEFTSGGKIYYATTNFILDNPPESPANVTASAGDGYARISWERHRDEDIRSFTVYYGTQPSPYPESPTSADYPFSKSLEGRAVTSIEIGGLENGRTYYFSVQAVDNSGNSSNLSREISATPRYELGFGSLSQEDIGCLIGTGTGYRSTLSRDAYRVREMVGKNSIFSSLYYSLSAIPLLLKFMDRHFSKALEGVLLFWAILILNVFKLLISPCIFLTVVFFSILMMRKKAFLFLLLFLPSTAFSQSPQNFYIDLKAGNMDFNEMSPQALQYWDLIYGGGGHIALEGELGVELPWKKFGTWRFSISGGIFWDKGYGLIESDGGYEKAEGKDMRYYIFPLSFSLAYHFKYLRTQIFVPFIKGGFTNYSFLEQKKKGEEIDKGNVNGYFYSAGVLFELNWIEPSSAHKLDVDAGINASYIVVEYRWSTVDSFGKWKDHNFSNKTLFAGLAFEF